LSFQQWDLKFCFTASICISSDGLSFQQWDLKFVV